MKILVVDDSVILRKIVRNGVELLNYEFAEAENGNIALAILGRDHADIGLVLLDCNMPGMNGMDVLEKMKSDPELKHIPVMMVTTESSRTNILKAIQVGAVNYLVKPFTMEELTKKILESLGEGA